MKKILITSIAYPLPMGDKPNHVNGVRPIVLQKFIDRGVIPILLSAHATTHMADELYELCDGVVFSGGSDMDPKYYNQEKHPETSITEPLRDPLELHLAERVFKDKKPALGLCRGCQLLAVANGGTLHQTIDGLCNNEVHGTGSLGSAIKLESQTTHIKPGTKIAGIITTNTVSVHCNHHQAVDKLGDQFIASGTTAEGIVEIIEHIDPDFFCFGIQSHPETEDRSDLELVFDAFVTEVKKRT